MNPIRVLQRQAKQEEEVRTEVLHSGIPWRWHLGHRKRYFGFVLQCSGYARSDSGALDLDGCKH